MNLRTTDKNGVALPAGFHGALLKPNPKIIIHARVDLENNAVLVEFPPERIIGFTLDDNLAGDNGYACSNTASLTLDNHDKIFSPQKFNLAYNAALKQYNGTKQADGRGNLRPWRPIEVTYELADYPGVEVPLIYGVIDGSGFKEKIGRDNENTVSIKINDLAKKLIDKKTPGTEVAVGTTWVEKELAYSNKKICDAATPADSIVHILANAIGGIPLADIVAPQTIPIVVPYFKVEKDAWSELALLADSVMANLFFDGKKLFFGDSPFFSGTQTTAALALTNDNFASIDHSEAFDSIKNKIKLSYGTYKTLSRQTLWMFKGSSPITGIISPAYSFDPSAEIDRNLWDPGRIYKCKYQIFENTPVLQAGMTTSQTNDGEKDESMEVVRADNIELETDVGTKPWPNGKIANFDTTIFPDNAVVRFVNSGGVFAIGKFKITGEPVVKASQKTAVFKDANSITAHGTKEFSADNKYITEHSFTPTGEATPRAHYKIYGDALLAEMKKPKLKINVKMAYPDFMLRSGMFVTIQEARQAGDTGKLLDLTAIIEKVGISRDGDSWSVSLTLGEFVSAWTVTQAAEVVRETQTGAPLGRSVTFPKKIYRRSATAPSTPTAGTVLPVGWSEDIPVGVDTLYSCTAPLAADGTVGTWAAPVVLDDRSPPTVPTSVTNTLRTVAGANDGAIVVGFGYSTDALTGVHHYNVYRREPGDARPSSLIVTVLHQGAVAHEALDATAVPGKTYRYGVSAVDVAGNESAIVEAGVDITSSVTVKPATTAAPTVVAKPGSITVSWAPNASSVGPGNQIVGYALEKSTNAGAGYLPEILLSGTQYVEAIGAIEVATLANYRYRVKAITGAGMRPDSWSAAVAPDTTGYGTYTPAVPTLTVAAAKRSVTLSVSKQANLIDPAGWDFQIAKTVGTWWSLNLQASADTGGGVISSWGLVADGVTNTTNDTLTISFLPITVSGGLPLASGETYYFRARAKSKLGGDSAWSAASAACTVYPTLYADLAAAQIKAANVEDSAIITSKIAVGAITAAKLGVTNLDVDGQANIIRLNAELLYSAGTAVTSGNQGSGAILLSSGPASGKYAHNYFDLTAGKFRVGDKENYLYYDGAGNLTFRITSFRVSTLNTRLKGTLEISDVGDVDAGLTKPLRLSADGAGSAFLGVDSNTYAITLTNTGVAVGGTDTQGYKLRVHGDVYADVIRGGLGDYYHSGRDFVNGTLITTSIDYSLPDGAPWVLEIKGNSYGLVTPYNFMYQGYIYGSTVINHGGHTGGGQTIPGLVLFNYGGKLCFWFPRLAYWQGFYVKCYEAYATYQVNKVVSITDVVKPVGITKEVACNNIKGPVADANGSVAIGTTDPAGYGLRVASSSAYKQLCVVATGAGTGGRPLIKLSGSYNGGNGAEIWQDDVGSFKINVNSGLAALAIDASGNVAIGTTDPAGYKLRVSGKSRLDNNLHIWAVSEGWAEGIAVHVPVASTWAGFRLQRERGNSDGNWYIGYTGLDSTDDMVFGACDAGTQKDNILRMTKSGRVSIAHRLAIGDVGISSDVLCVRGSLQIGNAINSANYLAGAYLAVEPVSGRAMIAGHSPSVAWTDLLINPNGGNVAIGTTDPGGYKLRVVGVARATRSVTAWTSTYFYRETSIQRSGGWLWALVAPLIPSVGDNIVFLGVGSCYCQDGVWRTIDFGVAYRWSTTEIRIYPLTALASYYLPIHNDSQARIQDYVLLF